MLRRSHTHISAVVNHSVMAATKPMKAKKAMKAMKAAKPAIPKKAAKVMKAMKAKKARIKKVMKLTKEEEADAFKPENMNAELRDALSWWEKH